MRNSKKYLNAQFFKYCLVNVDLLLHRTKSVSNWFCNFFLPDFARLVTFETNYNYKYFKFKNYWRFSFVFLYMFSWITNAKWAAVCEGGESSSRCIFCRKKIKETLESERPCKNARSFSEPLSTPDWSWRVKEWWQPREGWDWIRLKRRLNKIVASIWKGIFRRSVSISNHS